MNAEKIDINISKAILELRKGAASVKSAHFVKISDWMETKGATDEYGHFGTFSILKKIHRNGLALLKSDDATIGLKLLKQLIKISKQGNPEFALSVMQSLYKHYESIENYSKALKWINKYEKLNDDFQIKQALFEQKSLKFKFELRKREGKRIDDINKKESLKEKTRSQELNALQSQLNPHFLFNSLNAIQRYILKRSEPIAGDYLAKFSVLMRLILTKAVQNEIKISDECSLIENYLQLEQLRFDFQFSYHFEVSKNLHESDVTIPCFLLQPFVENAVVHGVASIGKGEIKIVLRGNRNSLYIHIIDNGKGRNQNKIKIKEHQSRALEILNERCRLLTRHGGFAVRYKLIDIQGVDRRGTHVLIKVAKKEKLNIIKNTKYD